MTSIKSRGIGQREGFTNQQMYKFRARGYMPDTSEIDARYVDVLRSVKAKLASGYRLSVAFRQAKEEFGITDQAASMNGKFISRANLLALMAIEPGFLRAAKCDGDREKYSYNSALRIVLYWVFSLAGLPPRKSKPHVDVYCQRGPIHGGSLITIRDGRIMENPFEAAPSSRCLVYSIVNIGDAIRIVDRAFDGAESRHLFLRKKGEANQTASPQ